LQKPGLPMETNQVRYDPIWRRIKSDQYALKLEGKFRPTRDRLAELNNWGSLAWLYPHATATKLAHHYGVEYNALQFLNADPEREKYQPAFRIASHALHWGHVPLSYAGAEGIVRAAHVDAGAAAVLKEILDEVIEFGGLKCASEDHWENCAETVLEGEYPYELYKWLSAWLVKRRWRSIWRAVKSLVPEDLSQEEVRKGAIRTLVCREDTGYRLLSLCRLADYVPRDLLQAGTAWLTVDAEALWETSPVRSDRAQEWSLLEAARDYLEDRFFLSPDAQLVHSLASRAVAQGLLSQGMSRDRIIELLEASAGDNHYFSSFSRYHRERINLVKGLTKGETLRNKWAHIGTFHNVRVPPMTRLDAEDLFSKRKGQGRLSYPVTRNYSVVIEAPRRIAADPGEMRRVAVCLHHKSEKGAGPARPALDIALEIRRRQGRFESEDVAAGVAGWLSNERIELRQRQIWRAAGRALSQKEEQMRQLFRRLRDHSAFSPDKDPNRYRRFLGGVLVYRQFPVLGVGRRVLDLPLSVARSRDGKELLNLVKSSSLLAATSGERRWRGLSLEAAVAADQLMSSEPCTHRLVILGATALASEGQPIAEWDVLRLDLLQGSDWRLVAVECSITDNAQKAAEDREKLELMGAAIDQRFSDLSEYQALLATLNDGTLRYTDSRRGFTRT
jgi:hypothetical protein